MVKVHGGSCPTIKKHFFFLTKHDFEKTYVLKKKRVLFFFSKPEFKKKIEVYRKRPLSPEKNVFLKNQNRFYKGKN